MASPLRQRLLKEIAFVLIVGVPVLLFFLATRPRANASRLLKQLHSVEVGTTPFRTVEALAQRFAPFGAGGVDTSRPLAFWKAVQSLSQPA